MAAKRRRLIGVDDNETTQISGAVASTSVKQPRLSIRDLIKSAIKPTKAVPQLEG